MKQKKYAAVPATSASQRNLSEVEMGNGDVDDIIHDVREGVTTAMIISMLRKAA